MQSAVAADYYRRALAAAETVRDRNDVDVQTIYGNLALALSYQGDFAGADRAYETAARLCDVNTYVLTINTA